jgi:hypothetical protein
MNWRLIDRAKRIQKTGIYTDWKEQIADDCHMQCVYCCIGEEPWGGLDHYHIDHFKPIKTFPELQHIITNLYLACPICNRFKSDFWLVETKDLNLLFIPDPSDHNYCELFTLDIKNFKIVGLYPAAKFVIERLYLNRPQLIHHRREVQLEHKAKSLIRESVELAKLLDDKELSFQLAEKVTNLMFHLMERRNVRPYKLSEIRKPK